ncbi:hypothetical protein [Labedella endophytica]|jgi:hypothetical protein|uniref:Uncharacterized protein n=1 Tax=Labedella endophytica TaxID=1523160 RepID=A0A433JNX8_9MICO|nr:hypothetical protein [Labedella endophytica]RUQ97642.1 hypothetical protein ELQ94_15920 [Labedella endophytica]
MTGDDHRTKWGRSKIGSGRVPAMAIAIPFGVVIGFLLSLVAVWAGIAGPDPIVGAAAFALCLAVPATMSVWVLVLDRSSLEGAAELPEESIESRWYTKAAAGAQTDVILLAGIAALALTLLPGGSGADPRIVLLGVIGASFVSFSIRYQVLRRTA